MSSVPSAYARGIKQDNGNVRNVMQPSELMTSIKFIYHNNKTIIICYVIYCLRKCYVIIMILKIL